MKYKTPDSTSKTIEHAIIQDILQEKAVTKQKQRDDQKDANLISTLLDSTKVTQHELTFLKGLLLANKNAFSAYFDLDTYKQEVTEATSGSEFNEILKSWPEKVNCDVTGHELSWRLNAKFGGKTFMMVHKWFFEVNFIDWSQQNLDPLQLPLVSWFEVTDMKRQMLWKWLRNGNSKKVKLLACFGAGDSRKIQTRVTQYALETKHGIFNPQCGLGGTEDDAYLMGLHVIPETVDDLKASVTVSENLLFTATKSISENELMFFKFETTNKNISRPQIKSLPPKYRQKAATSFRQNAATLYRQKEGRS
jgi:hypothetical protein